MSLTNRVLLGLVAGFGLGLALSGSSSSAVSTLLAALTAVATVLIATPALARIQIDQGAAMALRGPSTGSATSTATATPTLGQWFIDLVSQNVVKAAADGAMLPVIVFSVLFGVALAGIAAERRDAVLRVTQGVADAVPRLGSGRLVLAAVRVFPLARPLAA